MVNTTVPLPAPTLLPKELSVILMLQLTLLDTPAPTTPLILLDIPAPTTPLLLDIPVPTTPLLLDIPAPTTLLWLDILPPTTQLWLDTPASTTRPLLGIPPCITPLILDILTPTTPLILDIPQSTRLPSTTKLKFNLKGQQRASSRNKSLGIQPQLKNRFFFPQELQLPKENTRSYVHSCQINIWFIENNCLVLY